MLISLVVIRLEIADDSDIPSRFKTYCAPEFDKGLAIATSKDPKPSYAQATKYPSASKESTPARTHYSREELAEYRGLREETEICIELLSSEDIQRMEKEAEEGDRQKKSADDPKRSSHRKSQTPEPASEVPHRSFRPIRRSESFTDSSEDGPGPTPETTGSRPKSHSPTSRLPSTIHFVSGNPSVELVKGTLHLYKDSQMTSLEKDVARSEMLCMIAIPAAYTIHDLIKFTAPLNGSMEHMQVLKGALRNQYMLLIKFKDQAAADEFYSYFNSRPFNSIESDLCQLVYVAKVEIIRESEGGSLPMPGLTELPHCPVCLERMEESVNGVLTVLCNHSFHMACLAQWGDTTCPVCRYCQTPEEVPDQRCMKCGSEESLWICLICGSVGCGRYVGLHAYKHFQETNHTYAMQLGSNRVWDYAGDNYVHRLAQNKSDGKLVQVDEGGNIVQEEKFDSITLEYTYLLTTQLESQRRYFEEKMIEATKDADLRVLDLEEQLKQERDDKFKVSSKLSESVKEKQGLDKRCTQLHSRLNKVLGELQEERDMNKCLLENQQLWQKRVTALETTVKDLSESKEKEISELRDQLRDVMFFLEAQDKLANSADVTQEEIQDGQVIVGAAASSASTSARRGRKKRK